MDLKKKTLYIPGFVPGETEDEVIQNLLDVATEIASPRECHILQYCKRARIRKKYIDRLIPKACAVILLRQISEQIGKCEKNRDGQNKSSTDGA